MNTSLAPSVLQHSRLFLQSRSTDGQQYTTRDTHLALTSAAVALHKPTLVQAIYAEMKFDRTRHMTCT
jgi:hypothetical protein